MVLKLELDNKDWLFQNLCGLILTCMMLLVCTESQAVDRFHTGIMACWQHSGFFSSYEGGRAGIGLNAKVFVTDSWFVNSDYCAGSSSKPDDNIDLQGFDRVNADNKGHQWVNIGLGRQFFQVISLNTGIYYLREAMSYYLIRHDNNGQNDEVKRVRAGRDLLGTGASLELRWPTDSSASFFGRMGLVQYFYNFNRSKIEHQFYRTSMVGISFGL